ncbi:MAG TPA: flagellar protein FlaG [Accumulibacter sp.]|nr:flagellar protein FlaG [Accumulibacter sp.]
MNIQSTGAVLPAQNHPAVSNLVREISRPKAEESTLQSKDQTAAMTPAAPEQSVDRAKLEAATKVVREFVQAVNNNLEFSVDKDSGQTVVKVVDRSTREVIRQVPSEEMLALAKTLDSIKGLFVKQTA